MDSYNISFLIALFFFFCFTTICIIVTRPLAIRIGLVDHPGGRKTHAFPVPLIGGLSIFLGLIVSVLIMNIPLTEYKGLLVGSTLFLILGLFDDFIQLPAKSRLILQSSIILISIMLDNNIISTIGSVLPGHNVTLGYFAIPFTIFAIIGIVNAINMLDGIDGLAGMIAITVFFSLFHLSYKLGYIVESQIIIVIITLICAYLIFNLKREKKVFLGDAGSMMLGFILAWTCIKFSQEPISAARPITFLWLLGLPVCDTISVMYKRKFSKLSVFSAGRDHIHHILLQQNYSLNKTRGIIILISINCCAFGLISEHYLIPESLVLSIYLLILFMYIYINYNFDVTKNKPNYDY